MYGRDFYGNADCVDCDHVLKCTACYECVNAKECWECKHLQDCWNCQNCEWGYDLRGCQNCIGCAGLRKKSFHIFNQPYSEEEYYEKNRTLAPEEIEAGFAEVKQKTPRVYSTQLSAENCIGENISHSQNAYHCFDVDGCQDIMYIAEVKDIKDSCDIFCLEHAELCYECSSNYKLTNCNFCFLCCDASDLEYCELCFNCKDCFGCISLHNKQYYILNKPYSREEYFQKIAQLRKEDFYGRKFLPPAHPEEDTVLNWPCL